MQTDKQLQQRDALAEEQRDMRERLREKREKERMKGHRYIAKLIGRDRNIDEQ